MEKVHHLILGGNYYVIGAFFIAFAVTVIVNRFTKKTENYKDILKKV